MQRTVIVPADLSVEALSELKSWLGITRSEDDLILTDLLRASLTLCEAFTGQAPIEQTVEERIAPLAGHYHLVSRPLRSLVNVESLAANGARTQLQTSDYAYNGNSDGSGSVELLREIEGDAAIVSVRVGIAATWSEIPAPLKQGIIRLAAYHYRDRDGADNPAPPASVSALWRPWRRLSIA